MVFYYIHFSSCRVEEEGVRVGLWPQPTGHQSQQRSFHPADQLSWPGGREAVRGGPGSQLVPHRFPLPPGRWAGWPCTGLQAQGTSRLCGCSWCVCMSIFLSVSGWGRGIRTHSGSMSQLSLPRLSPIHRRTGAGWAVGESSGANDTVYQSYFPFAQS